MGFEKDNPDMDKLIETLRGIVEALNSRAFGDENPVLVEIATLKIEVRHLQSTIREMRMTLWGIAASLIGIILKMVLEGSLLK